MILRILLSSQKKVFMWGILSHERIHTFSFLNWNFKYFSMSHRHRDIWAIWILSKFSILLSHHYFGTNLLASDLAINQFSSLLVKRKFFHLGIKHRDKTKQTLVWRKRGNIFYIKKMNNISNSYSVFLWSYHLLPILEVSVTQSVYTSLIT